MFKGVNLHHFHNEKSTIKYQGSIEENQFYRIVESLKKDFSLISPVEWITRAKNNELNEKHRCLTFDDNIKSQIDIALPILDNLNIKAFFFIYTGMYRGSLPRLELYRLFRIKFFENFDVFFQEFLEILIKEFPFDKETIFSNFPNQYLIQYEFYSYNERVFRYVRDEILSESEYIGLMDSLILNYVPLEDLSKSIWMTEKDIQFLSTQGHEIGLHSVTHPTNMARFSDKSQYLEYSQNKEHLEQISGSEIRSIAIEEHACNLEIDEKFKPGLLKQAEAFINNNHTLLLSLEDQKEQTSQVFNKILNGNHSDR